MIAGGRNEIQDGMARLESLLQEVIEGMAGLRARMDRIDAQDAAREAAAPPLRLVHRSDRGGW